MNDILDEQKQSPWNRKRIIILGFTIGIIMVELLFLNLVLNVEGDLAGASLKSLVVFLFTFLVYKGYKWARIVLIAGLILFGIVGVLGGLESGSRSFYFMAALYFVLGYVLIKWKSFA